MPLPRTSSRSVDGETADVLVLYGVTGDLAKKMLFPALYRMAEAGTLDIPVLGVARADWDDDRLRTHAKAAIRAEVDDFDETVFSRLASQLTIATGDFASPALYETIKTAIAGRTFAVHYLALPPTLFLTVAAGLAAAGLNLNARLAVEKPFGDDLESARLLERDLEKHFDPDRLFRVDHFLGDETVRGIGPFRFANTMLEKVWNRDCVDNVQITHAEDFGVADRGSFYDRVGCLRDVVENHLFQVLASVATDPPTSASPQARAHQRWRTLCAVRTVTPSDAVFGQYDGYLRTPGVVSDSTTDTYAALRLFIDDQRWSGVPFYVRSGKKLTATVSEVVLQLRRPSHAYFGRREASPDADLIRIRLQPRAGVAFDLFAGAPAPDGALPDPVPVGFEFAHQFGRQREAYENVLRAVITGDRDMSVPFPVVEESWRIVADILDRPGSPAAYPVGSWGPAAADGLAGAVGWHEPAPGSAEVACSGPVHRPNSARAARWQR